MNWKYLHKVHFDLSFVVHCVSECVWWIHRDLSPFFLVQQRRWQTSSAMWPGLITVTGPRLCSDRMVRS